MSPGGGHQHLRRCLAASRCSSPLGPQIQGIGRQQQCRGRCTSARAIRMRRFSAGRHLANHCCPGAGPQYFQSPNRPSASYRSHADGTVEALNVLRPCPGTATGGPMSAGEKRAPDCPGAGAPAPALLLDEPRMPGSGGRIVLRETLRRWPRGTACAGDAPPGRLLPSYSDERGRIVGDGPQAELLTEARLSRLSARRCASAARGVAAQLVTAGAGRRKRGSFRSSAQNQK